MPSRFEPCGLNQLYSLKYGTVPIVRGTGGLADTITDIGSRAAPHKEANGFLFEKYDSDLLMATIVKAIDFFKNKIRWAELMRNGMAQDWSLERSALEYIALYKRLGEGK